MVNSISSLNISETFRDFFENSSDICNQNTALTVGVVALGILGTIGAVYVYKNKHTEKIPAPPVAPAPPPAPPIAKPPSLKPSQSRFKSSTLPAPKAPDLIDDLKRRLASLDGAKPVARLPRGPLIKPLRKPPAKPLSTTCLQNGSNPTGFEKELREACSNERLNDLEKLLEQKDVNINFEIDDLPFPHYLTSTTQKGSANNLLQILSMFIKHEKIDLGKKSKGGKTILHFAAFQNFAPIVKLLCDMEVDVNAMDGLGNTPLHLACKHAQKDRLSTILTLLEHRSDPGLKNNFKRTPFEMLSEDVLQELKIKIAQSSELMNLMSFLSSAEAYSLEGGAARAERSPGVEVPEKANNALSEN